MRMYKRLVSITAVVMTLVLIPSVGCTNLNARPNNKSTTNKEECQVNKRKKTNKEECPVNKGKKTNNRIYLYKVGTKNSKKTKAIHTHQTKKLYLKNKSEVKSVKWNSSNKKIAKVSKQGVITGLKPGKTTITAKVKTTKYQIAIKVKKALKIKSVNGSQLKQGIYMSDYYGSNNNILVSPASINMALGMAANGCAGKGVYPSTCGTVPNEKIYVNPKEELEKYLGKSTKNYNKYAKKIMDANDKTTLKMANSVWYKKGVELNNSFESNVKNYYNATTNEVTFDKSAVKKINSWVSDNTDGMIKKIIDNVSQDTYAYILNATLFDGKWTNKFDQSDIHTQKFKLFSGKKVKTKMMYGTENSYYENDYALAFEKTYEKNKKYSFIGIFPKAEGKFKLENLNISQLLKNKKKGGVEIGLPKFAYNWNEKINDALMNKGINGIFNMFIPAMNPMFDTTDKSNKYVNEIIHSTAIKVDSEGTKAAAVTSIETKCTSNVVYNKKIVLNRPFAYLIKNNETGEILFVGKVINPSKK